jgi:hypothetical protein
MTDDKRKFWNMLSQYRYLQPFWDMRAEECRAPELDEAMRTMSHGERLMAEFIRGVWSGEAEQFDLFEAAATMDARQRATVAQWIMDPFWP